MEFLINSPLSSILTLTELNCHNYHCHGDCEHTRLPRSDQWFVYLFIFRILVQICKTQAFQKLNPAQFDLHDAVNEAIQVSNGSGE